MAKIIKTIDAYVATFEKISFEQFKKDTKMDGQLAWNVYKNIQIPTRATRLSAGYDFVSPLTIRDFAPGEIVNIPTGIRVQMASDYVLLIFVRSSLGFKHQTVLVNGTGVIDADYYYADNEGHIWVKLRNDSDHAFDIRAGDKLVQGVLVSYGLAQEVTPEKFRSGGIGSTD